VEGGSIVMVGIERQLTLLCHCSRACGGILSRWFKV